MEAKPAYVAELARHIRESDVKFAETDERFNALGGQLTSLTNRVSALELMLEDPGGGGATPPPDPDPFVPDFTVPTDGTFSEAPANANILVLPGTYQSAAISPLDGQHWYGPGAHLVGNNNAHAFSSTARDVIIEGFEISGYDPSTQQGVIESTARRDLEGGWKVRSVHLHDNDEVGIRIGGHDCEIRDCLIEDQGRLGFAIQYGDDGYAGYNTIRRCNEFGTYSWGFEAGGSKCWNTNRLICEYNESYGHVGPGLWTDHDNVNTIYRHNTIYDCQDAPGIFHEISFEATIEDNDIRRCGASGDWLWDAGVQLSTSDGVVVQNNYIEDCGNGVAVISQDRGYSTRLDRPYYGRNCDVLNNTIVDSAYTGAVRADQPFPDIWTTCTFEGNDYTGCSGFAWQNSWIGWSSWQSYGHDLTGSFS